MEGLLSFDPAKGFGFITAQLNGGNEDIFVHRSALAEEWKHRKLIGQPCRFDLGNFKGRTTAVNVQIAQTAESYYLDAATPEAGGAPDERK